MHSLECLECRVVGKCCSNVLCSLRVWSRLYAHVKAKEQGVREFVGNEVLFTVEENLRLMATVLRE
jgi:hypothetical protein